MSDLAAPDAGAPQSASTESSPVLEIPKDAERYAHWRQTGEIESKPKEEADSAPAKDNPAEGEQPEEKSTASEAEEKQERQPKRTTAADRKAELSAEIQELIKQRNALRAEVKQPQQAKPPETTVNPPAQPQQPPKELKAPKLEDFKSWEEFEQAREAYSDQRTQQKVQQFFAEYQAQQQQAAVQQQAQQRIQEAKQRYGDEAETSIVSAARAVFNDAQIHPDIKYLVNQSPVMTDLLYVMGSNQADFDNWIQTVKTNPGEAIRRLVTVENLVIEELQKQQKANGQGERDESGKFVKTPARKVSESPPPATEVSGKSTPPKDAAQAAFERGDFRAFRNEENRRELAAKRGL